MTVPILTPLTDGLILIRPPGAGDAPLLISGRDAEFHRWLGPGAEQPAPIACIEIAGHVAGWIDYDLDREWLRPGEVNVGYNVFASYRGKGYATRAVQLLMHHLALSGVHGAATLLIDRGNERSLAVAARTGFARVADLDHNIYFRRAVPPLRYSDGIVTIRRPESSDLDSDIDAKDEAQMRWMWQAEERDAWQRMGPSAQRAHAARGLQDRSAGFGSGPKWTFSVDTAADRYVAYIDCDLANEMVPMGEANIADSCHPAHRGKGYVSRAVRLMLRFLGDHTGAGEAHLLIDAANVASLRVAAAVGAIEPTTGTDRQRGVIRFVLPIRPGPG